MKRLIGILLVTFCIAPAGALAQDYPNRSIRLVVPFAPGGSADAIARPLAEKLGAALGQSVVVDNKGGGLTVIAGELVAKSPADGYTLYLATATHPLLPYLVKSVPFDPIKDFTPIAMMGAQPQLFLVHPSQPFNTLPEMIAYAKANPGKLSIGISDAVSRANAETLKAAAGIDVTLVNYKGGGPLTTDLLAGHVPVGLGTPVLFTPYQKDRKLKALAVTSPNRLSFLADVPTVTEVTGIPNYDVQTWYVVLAPAGLPPAIVDRLQKEIAKVAADADMRKRFVDLGVEAPTGSGSAAITQMMTSYGERIGQVLKSSGVKPE